MPKKPAPPKTMYVILEPAEHEAAKDLARIRGVSLPNLFRQLTEDYAAGPMPEPLATAMPQSQMKETRVEVPQAVYEKAAERAKREQRHLSDVLATEVGNELDLAMAAAS